MYVEVLLTAKKKVIHQMLILVSNPVICVYSRTGKVQNSNTGIYKKL